MNKYTAEFVEAEVEVAMSQGKHGTAAMFREFAALLRERESAKARVTDETRGTYACPICGKEYPHSHPEDTSRVNWHSDYRKVFEDIISANVRLYKDGVSIAPTNYSHESKLTVAGIAGHWFAYGAEDARSFGRESKGTDSAAWSEFASNGDGYAYAWMDSLWSLFKQTVVALKGREAVAPMLASARVPADELRAKFEAWFSEGSGEHLDWMDYDKGYNDYTHDAMWQAYQGAHASRDAEVEALRSGLAEAKDGWHQANGVADLAIQHRDAAEAEVAALRKDAERYRAFRRAAIREDDSFIERVMLRIPDKDCTESQFDEAIDAAMQEESK